MNNDDSVIVLTDENGEFRRKGKNHPDNIIVINLSDEETSDNEANANLSATGSVLGSAEEVVEKVIKDINPTSKEPLAKRRRIVDYSSSEESSEESSFDCNLLKNKN